MLLRWLLPAAALFFSCGSFATPTAADFPGETDRLIATAKLWAAVNYFHPKLTQHQVNWDAALVAALPAIRTAGTPSSYAAGLRSLLDQLHDSSSFVSDGAPRQSSSRPSGPSITRVHHGVHPGLLIVDQPPPPLVLSMGAGVTATLNLSEPVGGVSLASPAPEFAADPRVPYPSVEYRILAAFKMWATVRNFFAYRDLMDGDWDDFFAEFLPKFIAARTAQEYHLAAAAALTHVDDTNAKINSSVLDAYFGVAAVGLRIRLVEKKPVVTAILDDEATKAGIKIGDVITSVDGEEIVARIHREIEFIPASTNQSLAVEVCKRLLNGTENSAVVLSLQSGDGNSHQVTLHRSSRFASQPVIYRSGDATRFLSKAIGYVDLEKVTAPDLDSVFDKFARTTAIIFDLRGPIHFDPELLASRLTAKSDTAAAIVTGPITIRPDLPTPHTLTDTASFFRVETFPASAKPPYTGKTIAIIDELTAGRAEHLGLLLEAANSTTFVGSLSAGVDGESAEFQLPGSITYSFSTTDVRHGNGGKLQRVGLQPSEMVSLTVHSIRTGVDETLEKAINSVAE
jgi:C-terminal processing protease CtpA/Prc